ncbi:MAG: chloride channel protein [Alphaproteobacteria bacterium]|nr:chloride channel protein [Alphaproteobacteria bacterium]MCY4320049.1 chloride channel protein [Alphaproteobacteria bacterium]
MVNPVWDIRQRAMASVRQVFDDQQITLSAVALVIGLAVGCCAVLFRELLALFQSLFFGTGEENLVDFIAGLPAWQIVLAPTAGGLVVGLYLRVFLDGRPTGVAQVMEASAAGGRMDLPPALHGAVVNALTLGCGGSSGREGPVVHLGAAVASWLARWLHDRRGAARTLLACGVAGAVAASFNAPFAGIFFAQELVIGRYAFGALVPVAVSSVVATLISHAVYGAYPAFIVPEYSLGSWLEFPAFVLLGVLTALIAVVFIRSIRVTAQLAEASTVPAWLRPALAGLAVGLIAVIFPQVLGVGYGATDDALKAEYGLWLLVGLIFAKTAATSLTIGGGFGGGVFSPSLFLGAMLGGAFGSIAGSVAPHLFAGVGAYAMVGMGAMAGAVLGAPISTILIMVELTGDYQLTMAVTIATVTAAMLTRALNGASYFRTVLAEKGIDLDERLETDAMRQMRVRDVMSRSFSSVPRTMKMRELRVALTTAPYGELFVVDPSNRLFGTITLADLDEAAFDPVIQDLICAGDAARLNPPMLTVEDDLENAFNLMETRHEEHIAVVDNRVDRHLVGFIHERDVMLAYNRALVDMHRREGTAY